MVALDGNSLTLETLRAVVQHGEKVELSKTALQKLVQIRKHVDQAAASTTRTYSINTGFGILSKVTIPKDQLDALQVNLIRSHCVGVGEIHSELESRAILLLRTNVLAKGYSGVRVELVELLIAMLNCNLHPVIPCKGSVGASGDLAPLAHLAAVLIGEGEAFYQGKRMAGATALKQAGLKPVQLAPKEGLSLINGTQQMTALGSLTLLAAEELAALADLICSTSLEGVLGSHRAYSSWIQQTRPYAGQIESARMMSSFMEGSEIYDSHKSCDRVQDPYSFRCAPQVHGSCRDLLKFVRSTLSVELNSATDNPLINTDTGEIVSNGNFHGQPVAFAMDILSMALCELGSLSERRSAKLIDPGFSELPAFLVKNEGLNSGYMIAHVTAAALVSENRVLSHPASTDSIPTNNEKEDHVSMGPFAARKAQMILRNAQYILAIESLLGAQALDFRLPLKSGKGPQFLWKFIRAEIPALARDRVLSPDIEWMMQQIQTGGLYLEAKKAGLW